MRTRMETTSIIERYGGQSGRSIEWDARVDKNNSLQPIGRTERRRSNRFSFSTLKSFFMDVFLPQGYPESVTDDYMEYQMWDTMQAFASSITGALATEAVLKGAGVGDETATALAATLTWLLKDGTGMVGRIAFAWARGTQLDSDCKKWRLVADILNDLAIMIDLLAPHFRFIFTYLVCLSSLCRSIVGVAGGATRAALTQHQARRNNLADVSAKDGSQETLVNLSALMCNLTLLPLVSGKLTIVWTLYTVFTALHIFANYRAVRSLRIDTLNRKRLHICVRNCKNGVLDVTRVNQLEPLFQNLTGPRYFGCTLQSVLERMPNPRQYRYWHTEDRFCAQVDGDAGFVALREDAILEDQLRAAFMVEYYSIFHEPCSSANFDKFREGLVERGWRLEVLHLEFDEWRYSVKKYR